MILENIVFKKLMKNAVFGKPWEIRDKKKLSYNKIFLWNFTSHRNEKKTTTKNKNKTDTYE